MGDTGRTKTPDRTGSALMMAPVLLWIAALLSSGLLLAGSRSAAPVVLGRYSLPLSAAVAVNAAVLILLAGRLLLAPRGLLDGTRRLFMRLGNAGALAEVLLFGIPVLLALFFSLFGRITPLAAEGRIRAAGWLFYASLPTGVWGAGGRARLKLSAFRGALTLLAFLLAFAATEVALRIVMPGSVFHPMLDLRPNVRVALRPLGLPGVSPSGIYSTNKWGMRGEQPPEDWADWLTIVCIGGSTTQCFELDDHRTWPWLLQEDLRRAHPRVWVGNGGLGGHSTRGHIVFMREVIPVIHPDIVIFLVGVNELSIFAGFDPRERASLGTSPETFGYRLFCASRTIQILYMLKKDLIDGVPVQNTPWASAYAPTALSGPEPPMPGDMHELMCDPDYVRDNVRQLIALARQYGVTPVFLTQSMLYDDTPYWRTINGGIAWERRPDRKYSAATVWRMLDTVNRDVIETCGEEGVLCYDLASVVSHDPAMFYDEAHFSEAGAALVADSVSAFLLRSGVIH